jgi:Basic region leucine zipper
MCDNLFLRSNAFLDLLSSDNSDMGLDADLCIEDSIMNSMPPEPLEGLNRSPRNLRASHEMRKLLGDAIEDWAAGASPLLQLTIGSPKQQPVILSPGQRFAISPPVPRFDCDSPGIALNATDYIGKILSDDSLLRSPIIEAPSLFVDMRGQLVMPLTPTAVSTATLSSAFLVRTDVDSAITETETAGVVSQVAILPSTNCEAGQSNSTLFHPPTPPPPLSPDPTLRMTPSKSASMPSPFVPFENHVPFVQAAISSDMGSVPLATQAKTVSTQGGSIGHMSISRNALAYALATVAADVAADKRKDRKRKRTTVPAEPNQHQQERRRYKQESSEDVPDVTEINLSTAMSEEEQKRIRRVKNRASVEKCRNKQRKRMEALEQEKLALIRDNKAMLGVCKAVIASFDAISTEAAAITGLAPALTCKH